MKIALCFFVGRGWQEEKGGRGGGGGEGGGVTPVSDHWSFPVEHAGRKPVPISDAVTLLKGYVMNVGGEFLEIHFLELCPGAVFLVLCGVNGGRWGLSGAGAGAGASPPSPSSAAEPPH